MHIAPVIEKNQAEESLSRTNGLWPSKRKIIKVELFYLPVFQFTIKLENKRKNQFSELVSVDGIRGEFAFFLESEYVRPGSEIINKFDFKLTESMASEIAIKEYQRLIYKNNLKNSNFTTIKGISQGIKVYYPYWVGYFRHKIGYDFDAMDAVGGNKPGIKMRPVFMDLLLQASSNK